MGFCSPIMAKFFSAGWIPVPAWLKLSKSVLDSPESKKLLPGKLSGAAWMR